MSRESDWYDLVSFILRENSSEDSAGLPTNLASPYENQVFNFLQITALDFPDWANDGSTTADDLLNKYGEGSRFIIRSPSAGDPIEIFWTDIRSAHISGDWTALNEGALDWHPPMVFTTEEYTIDNKTTRQPVLALSTDVKFKKMALNDENTNRNSPIIQFENLPTVSCDQLGLGLLYTQGMEAQLFAIDKTAEDYTKIETHEPILTSTIAADLNTSFDNLVPEVINYNDGEGLDGEDYDDYYKMIFVKNAQNDPHHAFTNWRTGHIDVDSLIAYHTALLQDMKSGFTNIDGRLNDLETFQTTVNGRVDNVENDLSTLSGLITANQGDITANETTISGINVNLWQAYGSATPTPSWYPANLQSDVTTWLSTYATGGVTNSPAQMMAAIEDLYPSTYQVFQKIIMVMLLTAGL